MAITNITDAIEALKEVAAGLPAAVTVDNTLSVEGAAADAKIVGDKLTEFNDYMISIVAGIEYRNMMA